jgi:hypothetical protein
MRASSCSIPLGRRLHTVPLLLCTLVGACGGGSAGPDNSVALGGSAGAAGSATGSVSGTTATGAGTADGSSTSAGGGSAGSMGGGGAGSNGGATGGSATAGAASDGGGSLGGSSGAGGNSGAGSVAGGGGSSGAGGVASGGASTEEPTTIWIAGDSTVKTYAAGNTDGYKGTSLEGWGQELGSCFNDKVTIHNEAIGGRSVAIFMWETIGDVCVDDQGLPQFKMVNGSKVDTSGWAKIKNGMKPGDFLLIQFGHNDETHTCPRFVSVTDFATYLGFMADTAVAKGATPVFVTPMGHRTFTGTKFNNTLLPYAQSMKGEAQLKGVGVLDLNLRSGEYYETVGNAFLTTNIFDGGTTHFIRPGAVEMATLIVGEIKKQGGRLASYLK